MLKNRDRLYLLLAILAVFASTAYWTAYGMNKYSTFQGSFDFSRAVQDMYYHIYNPNLIHGVQFFVFDGHLAPDLLLVLPFFYLHPSPLTLLFFQALVLSISGLIIFLIVKDLLRNSLLGLIFCIALLINPGVQAVFISSFHTEFFIIPFYLLVFYFYMKLNKGLFFLSALLLLLIFEVVPFMTITLGIGLFLFDYFYTKDKEKRRERLILSASLVIMAAIAILSYNTATKILLNSYAAGQYDSLPRLSQIVPLINLQVTNVTNAASLAGGVTSKVTFLNITFVLYGLLVAFLGFGIAVLFDPIITLIFGSQWLGEVFILGQYGFIVTWEQYFPYVLGGTAVATILGIMLAEQKQGYLPRCIEKTAGRRYNAVIRKMIMGSMICLSLSVFILSPIFVSSSVKGSYVPDLGRAFLFQTSAQERLADSQLSNVIGIVPKNASIMVSSAVMPHLARGQNIEAFDLMNITYYFMPEYILTDFNSSLLPQDLYSPEPAAAVYAFLKKNQNQYYLYAQNGTALLYKRTNST